ncbi:MAG: 30S ribosomal protein S12 methylthiotransferase RimO, partial [Clostridia bacterium]|nr:30S ribosomal protein S12 methylthiotransferase RimO [Clostridia bacterium]
MGFVSLGCPKNLTVTETMIGLLAPEYEIVTNPADADIIIVNTCGFIESAKQESIETIIEMGQYKDGGNLKKLIVTGCLAERYTEDILEQLPEVDAVVGTGSYFEIKKIIDNATHGERVTHKNDINTVAPENLPRVISTGGASAYLAIA